MKAFGSTEATYVAPISISYQAVRTHEWHNLAGSERLTPAVLAVVFPDLTRRRWAERLTLAGLAVVSPLLRPEPVTDPVLQSISHFWGSAPVPDVTAI